MSLHHLFPSIDLQPKPPKRILSLWNPADYAKLYGWIFHDPFTLDAYVEQFGEPPIADGATLENAISKAEQEYGEAQVTKVGWQLWLQCALLLAGIIILACGAIVYLSDASHIPATTPETNFLISFSLGEGILLVVYFVIGYVLQRPSSGALLGFILGLTLAVLEFYQLHFTMNNDSTQWVGSSLTTFNLLTGTSLGIMLNTLIGMIRRNVWGPIVERVTQWLLVITIVAFVIGYNRAFSSDQGISNTIQNIFFGLGAFGIGLIRPLDWLYGSLFMQRSFRKDETWTAPKVTLLPTANVELAMDYWLSNSWDRGAQNLNQLWQYTNLCGPVLAKMERELQKLGQSADADVTSKVAGLLDPAMHYGWTLDDLLANYLILPSLAPENIRHWWADLRKRATPARLLSASQQSKMHPLPPSWHGSDIPLNNRATASLAGFHYLRRQDPAKANQAFQKAVGKSKDKDMAKEMSDICANLERLTSSESWLDRTDKFFRVEGRPEKPKREDTWNALSELKTALDEAWLFRRCAQNSTNQVTLRNSVYDRLHKLQDKSTKFEEDGLIKSLAQYWEDPLNRWFSNPEKPEKPKAIENPYKFDQPLSADTKMLVGSKDNLDEITRSLERSQPIIIYGQAGMGKSSLIAQLPKHAKSKPLPLIVIDLASQNLPGSSTSQQVLKMLGQEIHKITGIAKPNEHRKVGSIRKPDEHLNSYLNDFHDFLVRACAIDPLRKFIVIIDRFDEAFEIRVPQHTHIYLEKLEEQGEDIRTLFRFLSNITHYIANFRVIYVGHFLPKEVQRILNEPLPIGMKIKKLTFLDEKGVKNLLNAPLATVIARFQDDAVKYIFQLSNGQPYLVQLIASLVIQKFNERQKEKGDHPDPVFTIDKVEEVVGIQQSELTQDLFPKILLTLPFWKQVEPFFNALLKPHRRLQQNEFNHEIVVTFLSEKAKGYPEEQITAVFEDNNITSSVSIPEILSDLESLDLLCRGKKEENLENNWKITIELLRVYLRLKA